MTVKITSDKAAAVPEALRLADELDDEFTQGRISNHTGRKAATELRRLHAENQRCKQVCSATSESWRADAESWNAQRIALLAGYFA